MTLKLTMTFFRTQWWWTVIEAANPASPREASQAGHDCALDAALAGLAALARQQASIEPGCALSAG